MQIAGGDGSWFSVRVYSLSFYLKKPTTKQLENAKAPLATATHAIKEILGCTARTAGRWGWSCAPWREPWSTQYNGALCVPMRLPRPPSHNNSRAEKSFHAFKLSDNKPSMGRRHKVPEGAAKKTFWVFITLSQWSRQVKATTTCYYCNQSAPAYTWQCTSKRQANNRARSRHKQYVPWQ